MARRAAYRKRRQNKFGMFLVFIVVVMLTVVVAVRGIEMKAKLADNRQREAELEAQIAAEEERTQEIEEMEKYSETLGYTEEVLSMKVRSYSGMKVIKDTVQMKNGQYFFAMSYEGTGTASTNNAQAFC